LMSPFTLCCFIFTVISHFYKDEIFNHHDTKHELLKADQSCPDKTSISNIKRVRIIKSNKSPNYGAKDNKKIHSATDEGVLNARDYR